MSEKSYFKQSFLKDLPYPKIIEELDYEKLLSEYEELFKSYFKEEITLLESDPIKAVLEALAYREMILRARINEAIEATFLHYAKGSDLDNVVGSSYLIRRLEGEKPTAKVEFELNTLLSYDVIIPKGAIFSNENADLAKLKEDVLIKKGTSKAQGVLELEEFIQSKETKTELLQTPLPFVTTIKQLEPFSGGASAESDESLRERAVMSVHRFSTAGSEKGYIYHGLSASAKVSSIKAINDGAGRVKVIIKSDDEGTAAIVEEYLSHDEVRPLTDTLSVELARERTFIVSARLSLLELSLANEVSSKINALQKDFDLSVDLALGFIYKCLHQEGVYKSEILNIKEKIQGGELRELPLQNIAIADNEFAVLNFELEFERVAL